MPIAIALVLIFVLYLIDKHNLWRLAIKIVWCFIAPCVIVLGLSGPLGGFDAPNPWAVALGLIVCCAIFCALYAVGAYGWKKYQEYRTKKHNLWRRVAKIVCYSIALGVTVFVLNEATKTDVGFDIVFFLLVLALSAECAWILKKKRG
jgi:hypothetical protein